MLRIPSLSSTNVPCAATFYNGNPSDYGKPDGMVVRAKEEYREDMGQEKN
jgi:hypothetical protein